MAPLSKAVEQAYHVRGYSKDTIPGHDILDIPCYSFLIEHKKSGKKILYDLGLMKEWKEKQPPATTFEIQNDIADQLTASNVPLNSINAIIQSHHHLDHTGDPSQFPSTTSLVVGPGFKSDKTTFPGWPRNPEAVTVDDSFNGREVVELDFASSNLTVGGFGDGSEFRPTAQLPLPPQIDSSLFGQLPSQVKDSYSTSLFESIHPKKQKENGPNYTSIPFYEPNPLMNASLPEAKLAIEKLQGFDALVEVFVIVAHDSSLLGILPFFPLELTQWDEADYKVRGRWLFLRDFLKDIQ
ncbi:hypothetical protein EIK77_009409 [Talaromyces pinophilus]|nr:hypothetical protein EIK77_009409 [Talaromyces pinophilus]